MSLYESTPKISEILSKYLQEDDNDSYTQEEIISDINDFLGDQSKQLREDIETWLSSNPEAHKELINLLDTDEFFYSEFDSIIKKYESAPKYTLNFFDVFFDEF
jgi:hypothetical protein